MTEFLSSDTGFILGCLLLLIGLMDIIAGLYLFGKKYRKINDEKGKLRNIFTLVMWAASFFVLFGLYTLTFHW